MRGNAPAEQNQDVDIVLISEAPTLVPRSVVAPAGTAGILVNHSSALQQLTPVLRRCEPLDGSAIWFVNATVNILSSGHPAAVMCLPPSAARPGVPACGGKHTRVR